MARTLQEVIQTLEALAPLSLAGSWDNVGVLVEPAHPDSLVHRGLLTIDLTSSILAKAIEEGAEFIVSYHPVLFGGAKALTRSNPHTEMIMKAVQAGVTIYSPHTALDAVEGGVNDWLIKAIGDVHEVTAIEPDPAYPAPAGMGRRGRLTTPTTMTDVILRTKAYLGLEAIRVATTNAHREGAAIETLAVCPGAGGSMLSGLKDVDLVLTGEMRHHDILRLNANGSSVVLTDHTNCERGYLPLFAKKLTEALNDDVVWRVSVDDRDPLEVV